MTVKDHYDNHLGNFYSWMIGDFDERKKEFLKFCDEEGIRPADSKIALDLGAGNGVQSVTLAEIGFKVKAIDFNQQLLAELNSRIGGLPIEVITDDIKNVTRYSDNGVAFIVCWGDTIAHLDSMYEIKQFLDDCFKTLMPGGKLMLSFRDYASELKNTMRFIPVKSDSTRILTCFLEYLPHKVRVTDLLYEKEANDMWKQKVSSYEKVRVSQASIMNLLQEIGLTNIRPGTFKGMVTLITQKS